MASIGHKTSKLEWHRVSRSHPCTICEKPDWCTYTSNGLICCMRVKSERRAGNGGWLHGETNGQAVLEPKQKPVVSEEALDARFRPMAEKWAGEKDAVIALAKKLGVSRSSLFELQVGWSGHCWSFPERTASGLTVGISLRAPSGKKWCVKGSGRGLTYSDDWDTRPGPVFIAEGGSDTATGLSIGLATIGRPSNTGGSWKLWELLRGCDREVIVLGERDRKDRRKLSKHHDPRCFCCQECFPGKYGAKRVAGKLSDMLHREVSWKFMPGDYKDLREWFKDQEFDPDDYRSGMALGRKLRLELTR